MEVTIVNYIKVRSLDTRKIGTLEGCEQELSRDELVVVEDKDRGEDVVEVIGTTKEAPKNGLRFSFVRRLTPRDKRVLERNENESSKAFNACKEKIKEYSLDMHLLKAYIPLSSTKVFFYYTADRRVDFRQLVRDLAKVLKKRIEMRQVGVRDAVQMMGWIGLCGDVPCCVRFLESFDSISLKDIEEQNLPLSPSKFTGPCGRLVCCLSFERKNYLIKRILPEVNSKICIDGQEAEVLHIDPLKHSITLGFEDKKKELNLEEILPNGYEKAIKRCESCGECCMRHSLSEEFDESANLS